MQVGSALLTGVQAGSAFLTGVQEGSAFLTGVQLGSAFLTGVQAMMMQLVQGTHFSTFDGPLSSSAQEYRNLGLARLHAWQCIFKKTGDRDVVTWELFHR